MKCRLKKNDVVEVTVGKDKGKTGRILDVYRERGRVVVEGINMVKKTVRPKGQNQKGGISEVESSLHVTNVMFLCKKCGRTRLGVKTENNQKTRICKKCGEPVQ